MINENNIQITSSTLCDDIITIITHARNHVYATINTDLVKRNWLLGKRIAEEELAGEDRAEYGKNIITTLSNELTERFGKGFNFSELYRCVKVYRMLPNLFDIQEDKSVKEILGTMSPKSAINILETLSPKSNQPMLSWSHYLKLLQVEDSSMRMWYANECANEGWSVRTLQRNISSQYCQRLLASQGENRVLVHNEMVKLTKGLQDPQEFIKNPVLVEFLGLSENPSYQESDLESAIISNLQKFLIELGKGWAFMGRQQRIHTEKQDYYIDLVFYNVILKCYILVDLKTTKVSYQDVGQMNMYIRMFDELKRTEGDNPTLGILLCSDTDEDIARYAINGNEQLFATKYLTCLPSKEDLKREIERQKEIYALQQKTE